MASTDRQTASWNRVAEQKEFSPPLDAARNRERYDRFAGTARGSEARGGGDSIVGGQS